MVKTVNEDPRIIKLWNKIYLHVQLIAEPKYPIIVGAAILGKLWFSLYSLGHNTILT